MNRHSSFNHPHYQYQNSQYMNGNGHYPPPPGGYPDHYQNENYYDIRRNKSSNDLLTSSSHHKEIHEWVKIVYFFDSHVDNLIRYLMTKIPYEIFVRSWQDIYKILMKKNLTKILQDEVRIFFV